VSPLPPTCYLTERNAVKLVKKNLGEMGVEAVLQRLDRLTQDEARTTALQIVQVVHGLFQNMNMVMDREQKRSASPHNLLSIILSRCQWEVIYRLSMGSPR